MERVIKKHHAMERQCKVKICGLSRQEDIMLVNEAGPDYIGFVFWNKSKRRVTKETAAQLKKMLDKSIQAVGVFVDEKPEVILDLLTNDIIDMAQLHGSESEADIRYIREKSGKPVIRMVRLTDTTDYRALDDTAADFLLFDSGKGSGKTFDWRLMEQVKRNCSKPFFLAGGISPDNVSQAIREVKTFAIDLSSSLETDGVKDGEKIRQLMAAIQQK